MTRFWRFTLLTLLIALLPLRGWAWAVMPVAVPGSGGPAQVMTHSAHAPAAAAAEGSDALPCHAQLGSPDATPSPSEDGFGQDHTCSLCDLCHAGVIAPPSWAWVHDAPPVAPPSWAVSVAHGRDGVDGLFRPPRA
ncbi:MAG: hypothetical protein A2711_15415 [Burkholderiales bacterium RIFCSPHIGHO2_01_FULL_63_240]|nr:MAG: hypothetical protein A2711_15415 [Burkholderiales bacterium RIFCSPHIGHO2_01_FULL_63_240]